MNNQITNDFDIMELIKALMSMKQQQQPQINPSGMLASLNQSPTQPSPTGMLNALAGSTAAGQASYQPKRTTPQDQSNWARFVNMGQADAASDKGDKKREDDKKLNDINTDPNAGTSGGDTSEQDSDWSGLLGGLLEWLSGLWK